MAHFEVIIPWLIYQEDSHAVPGKIVDLGDGAGLTRFGITQKNFGDVVPANFFTTMNFASALDVAKYFYQNQQWHHINGDSINSDEVAALVLSWSVNKSVPTAVKHLQKILDVQDDGVLGLGTLKVLNSKDPAIMAKLYRADWVAYYQTIHDADPARNDKYINGWIARANFPYPGKIPAIYAS